jgi:solute carrier family 38 (sodium-coupled neutral amino acid transporter), member 11
MWEIEVGENSSWIVSLATLTCCLGCALTYSIVLGDTFQSLALTAGFSGIWATRYTSILTISFLALYPLSRLQSLAALAPVSMVGVFGIVVTCIFMGSRYFGSAYRLPNGALLSTLAPTLLPSFQARTSQTNPMSALILGSMSATAFLSHFAAPDFLNLLKQGPTTLRDYGRLTLQSFTGVALINIAILTFGFLTFGGNSAGMVLNNYSNLDLGASVCRLLMAVSVIGGYPFLLRACNSSLVRLLWKHGEVTAPTSRRISATILAGLTGVSLLLKNAGLVVSFNGAVMGSAITYIFPAILLLKSKLGGKIERLASRLLIVFGVMVAFMGGSVSLMNAFAPNLLL